MRIPVAALTLALIVFVGFPHSALGGFDVTFWDLNTAAIQNLTMVDSERINTVQSPFQYTSLSTVSPSTAQADYSYDWLMDVAVGTFHTAVDHHIGAPEVETKSLGSIMILASVPLRVSVEGFLTYSHTQGDEFAVDFFASVRENATNLILFQQLHVGGNLYLQPASGTFSISGEAILSPGIVYRLRYGLDCDNTADLLPTGTLDAQGWVQFQIQPLVPEVSTLGLLSMVFPLLFRRRPFVSLDSWQLPFARCRRSGIRPSPIRRA